MAYLYLDELENDPSGLAMYTFLSTEQRGELTQEIIAGGDVNVNFFALVETEHSKALARAKTRYAWFEITYGTKTLSTSPSKTYVDVWSDKDFQQALSENG